MTRLCFTLMIILSFSSMRAFCQTPPVKYYCEVKSTQPETAGYKIYQSGNKFRIEWMINYAAPIPYKMSSIKYHLGGVIPTKYRPVQRYITVSLCDDNTPWTVWEYSVRTPEWKGQFIKSEHDAFLGMQSIRYRINQLVRDQGLEKIRAKYGDSVMMINDSSPTANLKISNLFHLDSFHSSEHVGDFVKTGTAKIAGVNCDIYSASPGTPAHAQNITYWVEPKTSLVLKTGSTRTVAGKSSVYGYEVTKFKLNPIMPESLFQLPKDMKAHLPDLFHEAKLPTGTTIIHDTGRLGRIGIDL